DPATKSARPSNDDRAARSRAACAQGAGRRRPQLVTRAMEDFTGRPLRLVTLAARRTRGKMGVHRAAGVRRGFPVDVRRQPLVEVPTPGNLLVHYLLPLAGPHPRSLPPRAFALSG